MRVARAALSVEVVLCHMSRFVSREACTETVRLPDSLYGVLRPCGSAGGTWARSWRESAREARLDRVSGALRAGWRSRVVFAGEGVCIANSHMWRVSLTLGGIDA